MKLSPLQYLIWPLKKKRKETGAVIGLQIITALFPAFQIFILAAFVDTALQSLSEKMISGKMVWMAAAFLGVLALQQLLGTLIEVVSSYFTINLNMAYESFLLEKRSRISYPLLEDNRINDRIAQVTKEKSGQMSEGFFTLMGLVQYLVRLGGILAAAAAANWMASLGLAAVFCAMVPLAKRCGEESYDAYEKASPKQRHAEYFRKMLTMRGFVLERTLFRYSESLNRRWEQEYEQGRILMLGAAKKNTIRMKKAAILIQLLSFAAAAGLLVPVADGSMTAGLYVAVLTAVLQFLSVLTWNLAGALESYAENRRYLADLEWFLALPEAPQEQPEKEGCAGSAENIGSVDRIEFRDVSFSYPGCGKKILNHISFCLEKGKSYGFAGENGAGKSTVMKLLLGFYPDYEGEILIGGTELRSWERQKRRALFSVVFQDFARYQMSLWDNLTIGCPKQPEEKEVMQVLEELGLEKKISALPDGLQTEAGCLTDNGTDFSGGEWQRLAIARALLQNSPVQILDEPTAAIDPIRERELYRLFEQAGRGDIQIMITHRLGGLRNVDCILLLKDGKIAEQGSHEELIQQAGIYAQMFESQRKWYQ